MERWCARYDRTSSFVALMKQVAPHIVSNPCAIYKYALACRTLPLEVFLIL